MKKEKDMSLRQPFTVDDLETYAEHTSSCLYYLGLEVFDIRNTNADYVASHIGVATGLTTIIRGIPHHLKNNELYLPMDLTSKVYAMRYAHW